MLFDVLADYLFLILLDLLLKLILVLTLGVVLCFRLCFGCQLFVLQFFAQRFDFLCELVLF